MKILISNTSENPLYQQIKDQIKDAILKEELVEGDPLPSIRAFANDLSVSVLTIPYSMGWKKKVLSQVK